MMDYQTLGREIQSKSRELRLLRDEIVMMRHRLQVFEDPRTSRPAHRRTV